ncbi:hypothetical protein GLOTRDRAFT_126622 [Gloeophyllum trabeum ATCC 11539]|uniref:Uncharacterized protein n=1 Tax=Gloeophyllum trabeum (strain ATCC 11539 / FP-39264 / Madison 617) TaxID=670483 RepID=S7RTV9_GLOTA|nr:uncharacterized protein GLOTRDRAFT_126622 [Gloeophyllum trabeum ATCC 11539]EPQ58130.1 hypothetical protein GLOTRDRAFT_126622 [Gloeophyllum trabeum ATCC 11539]
MTDNPSEVEDWEHEEIELHPSEYGNFDGQTHCEDHDSAGEYSDCYDCGDYPSFYEHEGGYDPRAYDSESDYDRIADEEGAAERHSQSARWFYGVGSSRRPPARLEGPDTLPKYVDDPNYLLYRSPPPWSVLGEIKPTDGSAGAAERRNEEDLVAVNRTNKKARLAVHMMKDMISKKKAKQIVDVGDSGGSNLAPIQSRNPFRKAPKIADNIAQMRSPATVMEGRPLEMSPNPLAIEPALHELGMEVQSTARVASLPVLRPVSAHKVPALPSPPPTQKKQQGRKPVKEKTPHRPPQRKRGGMGMSSAGGKVDGQKHKQFDWQAWGKPREST